MKYSSILTILLMAILLPFWLQGQYKDINVILDNGDKKYDVIISKINEVGMSMLEKNGTGTLQEVDFQEIKVVSYRDRNFAIPCILGGTVLGGVIGATRPYSSDWFIIEPLINTFGGMVIGFGTGFIVSKIRFKIDLNGSTKPSEKNLHKLKRIAY